MMYRHLDKYPHGVGWSEGLGPAKPVIRGDIMHGRGSSNDDMLHLHACFQSKQLIIKE